LLDRSCSVPITFHGDAKVEVTREYYQQQLTDRQSRSRGYRAISVRTEVRATAAAAVVVIVIAAAAAAATAAVAR